MMPWGHFAVAYLPYAIYSLLRYRTFPGKRPTLLLLFATQLPDLIDKPLAWSFHLLPSGRSLAHSVLIAVPLVLAVSWLAWIYHCPEVGSLFTLGYLSHLYGDFYQTVLYLPPDEWAPYLAGLYWPLLPVQTTETMAFLPYFTRVDPSRYAVVGLCLLVVAIVYGPAEFRTLARRLRRVRGIPPNR